MEERRRERLRRVREALEDKQQRHALKDATTRFMQGRLSAFSSQEELDDLKARAKEIKERAIKGLDSNVKLFTENVEANGGRVFRAASASDAVNYILDVAKRHGVKSVVKSKSLTSEEVGLNEALEENGIQIYETDLGERIVQLGGEKPSHFLAPAIHRTREHIAEIFSKELGREIPPITREITRAARENLRQAFIRADMGISGGNFAIAETGTIALMTNEGNARMVTSLPRVHLAIVGMEKVVRSVNDAITLLEILPKSATGQKTSTYMTFVSGPNREPHAAGSGDGKGIGPSEFHVVVLDNGRREMFQSDEFAEALRCLKCGACLNVCPVYHQTGGHAFGRVYQGGIGITWTAFTHSLEEASSFSFLCTGCGRCLEACPQSINIPDMVVAVRRKEAERWGRSRAARTLADSETMAELGSRLRPVSNISLRSGPIRLIMERMTGIDRRRGMPPFSRPAFRPGTRIGASPTAKARVAYFMDTFATFNDPELARDVAAILRKNDMEMFVPEQSGCGIPKYQNGDLEGFVQVMERNVRSLAEAVREGYTIVSAEPTAVFCLRREYPMHMNSDEARLVAENSYELFEFLRMLHQRGELNTEFKRPGRSKVGYHAPCHTRLMNLQSAVPEMMRLAGIDVVEIDAGCCGMAGTFGFKKGLEGYELSFEIGKDLFKELDRPEIAHGLTECSACRMQMEAGSSKRTLHPATLLRLAYEG